MLRTDSQVALNDVIVLCQDTVERYRDAARMVEDPELTALFEQLAETRDRLIAALATHIRQLGELPGAPDPERETVETVITRIKSVLSTDERLPLLEKCEQDERWLMERTEVALEQDLPENTRLVLRNLQRDVIQALERLTRQRSRI